MLSNVHTTFRIPLNPALEKREKVELLAPAGSFDALRAAVENGADAVYLGGQVFNARKFAANFSDEELRAACDYAHVRGVKVFLTLNTLIFNHEFAEAVRFVARAREAGVDALIIQDLGIMKAVRDLGPDFPIHISTQATVHNTEGIRFLEDLGAERVILARENSLAEIKQMRAETKAELEHFAHGAQCYCYSGQCLMSSVIGGRSGNRGACAYSCRLPFDMESAPLADPDRPLDAEDGADADGRAPPPEWRPGSGPPPFRVLDHVREKHVLSSKDMNDLEHVPRMIEAGVMSFKIEGRMKRPEYVATVVRAYRNAIDRHYAGNFHITKEEKARVLRVFNREFTKAWVDGKDKWNFTTWDTSGNKGTRLGTVTGSGEGWVTVKLEDELRIHDGIEIVHAPENWDRSQGGAPEDYGFEVLRMIDARDRYVTEAFPGDEVKLMGRQWSGPGDAVYKTADHETLKAARESYAGFQRRVPVTMTARVVEGEPLTITLKETVRGFEVTHESGFIVPAARNAPAKEKNVRAQLQKMGETPFDAKEIRVELGGNPFAPVSELNAARRDACAKLERAIAEHYHRAPIAEYAEKARAFLDFPTVDRSATRPRLAVNCWTLDNLRAALRGGARTVYFSGLKVGGLQPKWDDEAIAEAAALADAHGAELWLASGMIQKDYEVELLRKSLEKFPDMGVLAGNHGAFQVARNMGRRVIGDWMLNVYNSVTVDYYRDHGAERLTVHPELTLDDIAGIARHTPVATEALVHGRLTLMTSEYCSIGHAEDCQIPGGTWAPCHEKKYQLTDRVGAKFPLETDGACRMYILNGPELNMANRVPELARAGIDVFRIETIGSRPDAVEEQVRVYSGLLEAYNADPEGYRFPDEAWARLEDVCADGFTTGHYWRGPM